MRRLELILGSAGALMVAIAVVNTVVQAQDEPTDELTPLRSGSWTELVDDNGNEQLYLCIGDRGVRVFLWEIDGASPVPVQAIAEPGCVP